MPAVDPGQSTQLRDSQRRILVPVDGSATSDQAVASRVLLGSGAENIIREAPVPVLVIRSKQD